MRRLRCRQMRTAVFVVLQIFVFAGVGSGADLSVDEVISAIKKEIQSAGVIDAANPAFEITRVDVGLSVFITENKRGEMSIRVPGFHYEDLTQSLQATTYNKLKLSFTPTGSFVSSQEAVMGLVEPIKRIKTLLRNAYTNPPRFSMDGIRFALEFAVERTSDGSISFQVLELNDLKAINVATHTITIYFDIRK